MKISYVHLYQATQVLRSWGTKTAYSRIFKDQDTANIEMELIPHVGIKISAEQAGQVYTTVVPFSNVLSFRLVTEDLEDIKIEDPVEEEVIEEVEESEDFEEFE